MSLVKYIKTMVIAMLMLIVDTLANITSPTPKTMVMEFSLRNKIETLKSDTSGMIQMAGVLGGITLTISGFATLVLGNYIIYSIINNVPAMNNNAYNTTLTSISNYVGIVLPLFGLVMMVGGFALILMSLGVLNIINRQ